MTAEGQVWSVVTMRPASITAEVLGQPQHVRQCRVLARATSRAGFARRLIAAGLEGRSVPAVSAWLRDFGGQSHNADDLAAVTDDAVYVVALDHRRGMPYVRYPDFGGVA